MGITRLPGCNPGSMQCGYTKTRPTPCRPTSKSTATHPGTHITRTHPGAPVDIAYTPATPAGQRTGVTTTPTVSGVYNRSHCCDTRRMPPGHARVLPGRPGFVRASCPLGASGGAVCICMALDVSGAWSPPVQIHRHNHKTTRIPDRRRSDTCCLHQFFL
jgi:hypothetical protein